MAKLSEAERACRNAVRKRARRALKHGWITNPGRCEAPHCPFPPGVQLYLHHYLGYSKEHELDVVFLCRSCHSVAHSYMPDNILENCTDCGEDAA